MIILPSEILSRRSRATLPEGESFLSRHLRATLPEGDSLYIPAFTCHSPRRGKFLSRHLCATLPERESSYRCSAPLSIKAEGSYRHRVSLSPKGKAFYSGTCEPLSPKGKAFYPGICVPLSPKGKAFLYIPKGKTFLYLYIMLIHILFCSAIHFMGIVIWISIAPLYKTTSKFFHVKFFIVPLKLLDTLHKHRYNVECKIV